ncbi:hypothetical protein [Ktedonospora formicarum]|uniref:Uncharacterized protein n=1 Tax=Ktedonospora formicarum TaxID=2778364 RepID=A0A8J3MZI7_9CHLR|nr:hypothetical protein [Ktedonospora formicarum]GHO50825.1 hypothetical protein KSX_89880 [Ktedonospora formicarum]
MSKDPNKDLEQKAQTKDYQANRETDPAKAEKLRQEAKNLRNKKTS